MDVGAGPWVVLGSSTAAGAGAPAGSGWVSLASTKLAASGANFVNLAKSSSVTYHALSATSTIPPGRPVYDRTSNIDVALSYRPRVVILAYPTNDTSLGYSVDETVKNLLDMRTMALERGAQVIVMSTQPRDLDLEKRKQLQEINTHLRNVMDKCFVNVYSTLADSEGRFASIYDSGDGTHPNMLGHLMIANFVESLIYSNSCVRLPK